MNSIVSFLTSTEMIIVYIVALVAIFICLFIYVFDKNSDRRRKKQNTKELKRLVSEVNDQLDDEEDFDDNIEDIVWDDYGKDTYNTKPVIITPEVDTIEDTEETIETTYNTVPKVETMSLNEFQANSKLDEMIQVNEEKETVETVEDDIDEEQIQAIKSIEEIKVETGAPKIIESPTITETIEENVIDEDFEDEKELTYTNLEPTVEEARSELEKITELLEKEAESQEDSIEKSIQTYEEKQEKDAIISIDELLEKTKQLKLSNEMTDEKDAPISLEEFEKTMNIQIQPIEEENELTKTIEQASEPTILQAISEESVEDIKEDEGVASTFQSSPIISPVYGIEKKEDNLEAIKIENTANYEKLDQEIKKTNEFLSKIRELQKHLGD